MRYRRWRKRRETDVLVPDVLRELEFTVCAFEEDRGAERLHNLLVIDKPVSWSLAEEAGRSMDTYVVRKFKKVRN